MGEPADSLRSSAMPSPSGVDPELPDWAQPVATVQSEERQDTGEGQAVLIDLQATPSPKVKSKPATPKTAKPRNDRVLRRESDGTAWTDVVQGEFLAAFKAGRHGPPEPTHWADEILAFRTQVASSLGTGSRTLGSGLVVDTTALAVEVARKMGEAGTSTTRFGRLFKDEVSVLNGENVTPWYGSRQKQQRTDRGAGLAGSMPSAGPASDYAHLRNRNRSSGLSAADYAARRAS